MSIIKVRVVLSLKGSCEQQGAHEDLPGGWQDSMSYGSDYNDISLTLSH